MKVVCKIDDKGLYYNFIKGKIYNYNKYYKNVQDESGTWFYYDDIRIKEFFCTEQEYRTLKLQKINECSL